MLNYRENKVGLKELRQFKKLHKSDGEAANILVQPLPRPICDFIFIFISSTSVNFDIF
jgi:hypothetical protein